MSFCIYEFDGQTKDIAVIHENWIHNNMCYWPPFSKTAIKDLPDPQTWTFQLGHVVRNKFFDTYELARKDLEPAQEGSDFSANEVAGCRRRAAEMTQSKAHSESDESPPNSKFSARRNLPKSKKRKFPAATAVHKLPTPPTPTLTSVDQRTYSKILPGISTGEFRSSFQDSGPPMSYANCNSAGQTITGVPSQHVPYSPVITDASYNHQSSSIYKTESSSAAFTSGQQTNQVFGENVGEDKGQKDNAFRFNSHGFPYPSAEPIMVFQPPGFQMQTGFATEFRSNELIYFDPEAIRSLQRGQQILTAKVDILLNMTRTILITNDAKSSTPSSSISLLLTTLEECLKTESNVRKDKRFKQDLICILSAKGGNNSNQITYRIVAALMTDSLMRSFTFAGQTGKRSFKDTLFLDCICEAVRRCPKESTASDKDIEKAIDYWLKSLQPELIEGT